jgi:5-methyltetrahydropteroyltriglutamate--homocysteine methyltransferase
MARTTSPPFRADHVGSMLRPERLKQAREERLGAHTPDANLGPHDDADLRRVEDESVLEAIATQQRVGLGAATDGEYRRRSWWLELIMNWDGFEATRAGASSPFAWRNDQGKQQDAATLWVTGRIGWRPSPVVRAFEFLKANTTLVPKVTIPAPPVLHCFAGGDTEITKGFYDDIDAFWDDLIAAYRQEIAALVEAGARYIQLDDVALPFICDPFYADIFSSWGSSPEAMLDQYATRINQALDGLPDDVTVAMHQCRGNREGLWVAEGGYDPVADALFNRIDAQVYFLEYDTPRAGTFEPLRLVPAGKVAALGLVSTKTAVLEDADTLKRRIDEAARHAPLDRLALTTQCGFASSVVGNPLSEADQEAKLARLVEVADAVWG